MVVAISKVQFRLQANSCTAATATRLTSMTRRATSARFWPIVTRRSLISNLRNEPSCKGGALRKLEVDFGGCYALSFSTVNRFRSTVQALALSGPPVCDHIVMSYCARLVCKNGQRSGDYLWSPHFRASAIQKFG